MLPKMSRSKCHMHSDFFVGLPKCQQCMTVAGPWYPHLNNGLPGTRHSSRVCGSASLRSALLEGGVEWIMHLRDANRLAGPPQWVCVLTEAG